jgi:DNA-binding transcriptional ArsR family regulator
MVEQVYSLDAIFSSLSDPTRRDILMRLSEQSMSVGEVAKHYAISFAGVAKHLDVLVKAGLVHKTKQGKEQIVTIDPRALAAADYYLNKYTQLWEERLDSLDSYLQSDNKKEKTNGRE